MHIAWRTLLDSGEESSIVRSLVSDRRLALSDLEWLAQALFRDFFVSKTSKPSSSCAPHTYL